MKQLSIRGLGIVLILLWLTYAGDYISLRYKIPGNREQFGTVSVQSYYAVGKKNGNTEYDFYDPENETCVNSIFPHLGYQPRWYVRRHAQNRINV